MSFSIWVAGARPRTLPAAVVPVAVGTGVAISAGHFRLLEALLALGVALSLQVASNLSNDYSDGIRGTDETRSGPVRLVASGAKSPEVVKRAAFGFFLLAGILGLILAALTTYWLILVGAAAILAGWFYTGGPKPYGYYGYGELFVFIFFGLVAVVGTAFVQIGEVNLSEFLVAFPVGISSVCLLVVNNLRDIPSDSGAGKKTLAVRIGDCATRRLYITLIVVMFVFVALSWFYFRFGPLGLLAIPFSLSPVKAIRSGARGKELIPALSLTGRMQLALALFFSVGIAI
ncbi:MAG: 1,4-dihydroxy-2-naphthoate polyprenyltransferase [Acidimicrobiaceae bacterium]|nr:1,4-dihydroxy-2-naphthoate polyprenyltransferase [Acidimicrobiaceae bacterium]